MRYEAFLWKILFTAVTLEAGFKGGEIVPTFCIGATFGCTFAMLTGQPHGLMAACGMLALFAQCRERDADSGGGAYMVRIDLSGSGTSCHSRLEGPRRYRA